MRSSDPHEHLEIRDRQAIPSEVAASTCFDSLLQPREIEWDRPVDQRLALGFLFHLGKKKGAASFVLQCALRLPPLPHRIAPPARRRTGRDRKLADVTIDGIELCEGLAIDFEHWQSAPNGVSGLRRWPIGGGYAIVFNRRCYRTSCSLARPRTRSAWPPVRSLCG